MIKRILSLVISVAIFSTLLIQLVFSAKSPLIYFPFEEGNGIFVYDLASNLTAKADKLSWSEGVRGNSVTFSEDSKPILIQEGILSNKIYNSDGITVSLWVNGIKNQSRNIITIVGEENKNVLEIKARSNAVNVVVTPSYYDYTYQANFNVDFKNEWSLLTVSVDIANRTIKCYVDDKLVGTALDISFTSTIFLPKSGLGHDFIGDSDLQIDEFKIFNSVLDLSDVIAEFGLKQSTAMKMNKLPLTPIAQWDFDEEESSDIVLDSGPNGINGKIINGFIVNEGVKGNGITFDPTKPGYVDLGYTLGEKLDGASGITVSMWVQAKQLAATINVNRLFSTFIDSDITGLQLNIRALKPFYNARSTKDDQFLNTATVQHWQLNTDELFRVQYNMNIWYHVAAVVDFPNNRMDTYVNGQLMYWPDASKVNYKSDKYVLGKPKYPDTIGGDPLFPYCFGGVIDEVKVFDRALNQEEINVISGEFLGAKSARELDQQFISYINERMEDSIALYVGSGNVLHNGKINKINPENYSLTTIVLDDIAYTPHSVFEKYLGVSIKRLDGKVEVQKGSFKFYIELDGNTSYSNPSAFYLGSTLMLPVRKVAEQLGCNLFWDSRGIIIVSPENIVFRAEDDMKIIDRLIEFYEHPYLPEPQRNHEQSRVVVSYVDPSLVAAVQAPTLVKLKSGEILCSMTYYGNASKAGVLSGTNIFSSSDDGKTFKRISNATGVYTASLAEVGNDVYLIGHNSSQKVALAIAKSSDKGKTWTTPTDAKSGLIHPGTVEGTHIGPTAVLQANGRVYRAVEANAWSLGNWKTFMVSAPINSNLLDSANWTVTNYVQFDPKWLQSKMTAVNPGWIEGNPVRSPDGSIKNILRINAHPNFDVAAILDVSADNKTVSFNPDTGLINFPGGESLFVIKYDEISGMYFSLVNNISVPYNWYSKPRNILSLSVSKDLINWEVIETILVDRDMINYEQSLIQHSFQYTNWDFDGDDIIAIVRESADNSMNYHDANYATFYRIKNFRDYLYSPNNMIIQKDNAKIYTKGTVMYADENQKPALIEKDGNLMVSISAIEILSNTYINWNKESGMINGKIGNQYYNMLVGDHMVMENGELISISIAPKVIGVLS